MSWSTDEFEQMQEEAVWVCRENISDLLLKSEICPLLKTMKIDFTLFFFFDEIL